MSLFLEIPLSWLSKTHKADLVKFEDSAKIIKELANDEIELNDVYAKLYETQVPDSFISDHWRTICEISTDSFKTFLRDNDLSSDNYGAIEHERCHSIYNLSSRFSKIDNTDDEAIKYHEQWLVENSSYFDLLDYQEDVFNRSKDILKIPNSRFVIQMPTGSGKTRTAMELVCRTLNRKKSVLWLANSQELCDQAFDTFLKTWPKKVSVNSEAIQLQRHPNTDNVNIDEEKPAFYVSSIQGLWKNNAVSTLVTEKKMFKNVDLVVFDEAHMAVARTYERIVNEIISNSKYSTKFIGLTATPGRSLTNSLKRFNPEVEDGNRALSEFFNNKKISLTPVDGFETALDYLRSRKVIAQVALKQIDGLTIHDRYDSVSNELKNIISSSYDRNFNILASLLVQLRLGKRVLLFANSIEHSKFIVSIVDSLGITAQHLDSGSSNTRDVIINDFKSGKIQLLSNYGILSTGFDDPQLDVIFITRLTKSIILYSQMIGRVLRGPVINGTDTATVFTIDDNINGLPKNEEIYNYFDSYFESK